MQANWERVISMWFPSLIVVCAVQEGCTDKERLPGCKETPGCTRLNISSRRKTEESNGSGTKLGLKT